MESGYSFIPVKYCVFVTYDWLLVSRVLTHRVPLVLNFLSDFLCS